MLLVLYSFPERCHLLPELRSLPICNCLLRFDFKSHLSPVSTQLGSCLLDTSVGGFNKIFLKLTSYSVFCPAPPNLALFQSAYLGTIHAHVTCSTNENLGYHCCHFSFCHFPYPRMYFSPINFAFKKYQVYLHLSI